MINSYKDLIVWQKSFQFCKQIYKLSSSFPKSEVYGLTSQIRGAAVSIPSNISEGNVRGHRPEYIQFLRTAFGSAVELETQLLLAKELGYLSEKEYIDANNDLVEILKMLNSLIVKLQI